MSFICTLFFSYLINVIQFWIHYIYLKTFKKKNTFKKDKNFPFQLENAFILKPFMLKLTFMGNTIFDELGVTVLFNCIECGIHN